jgi:hypothetical protein
MLKKPQGKEDLEVTDLAAGVSLIVGGKVAGI